jgi:hypothetical protein
MKKILSLAALYLTLVCSISERAYSREIVFVHPDRQVFVSGETIRFSARLIDLNRQTDQRQSSVLYLQIAGPDGSVLLTVRSDIEENGISYGCIILPDTLTTGLYYLTAYTNCMRNYDSQWLWSSPLILVDRHDEKIDSLAFLNAASQSGDQKISFPEQGSEKSNVDLKIVTDKDLFGKREKVKVYLRLTGLENSSSYADISISVSEIAPFRFLHNEIPDIESFVKSIRFAQLDPEKAGAMTGVQPCRYLREDEGYILSGIVFDKSSGSIIQKACVLLSTPDTVADLKYSFTDTTGRFYFLLDRCYNNKELILQTKDDTSYQGNTEILIDDRSVVKQDVPPVRLTLDDSLRTFLSNHLTINLINSSFRKNYHSDEKPESNTCVNSGYDFFGKPDVIIYPSDFVDLPDFNEILENLTPYVKFRADKNGVYTVHLPSIETHMYLSDENALVLVNNVPLFEYGMLNNLNSREIEKIEFCMRMMMYGDMQISGIISVIANEDFLPSLAKENKVIQISNDVVKRNNGHILQDNKDSNSSGTKIPDFRQTLYWDPDVRINGNSLEIEFYTSDLKAAYEIKAQGLTGDGKPVYAAKVINIQ